MSNLSGERSTAQLDAEVQRIASKAKSKMRRIHDPYADLSMEINRMTSRDTHVRAH